MPISRPDERPAEPPGGYEPCPIDPDYDRSYILDEAGKPVRVYDYGVLSRWKSIEGKAYRLYDRLPEYRAEVRTYFSCWGSMHDDKPPTFWTVIKAGEVDKVFHSATWEEAQDKHARVVEKVKRVIPKVG
jgi:hypothetical protein